MAALAGGTDCVAVVGLQARVAPQLLYLRALLTEGYVGRVLSSTLRGWGGNWGPTAANLARLGYLLDASNGATLLTIPLGHTLAALRAVEVVAPTTASVLITGETGAGKEVIARALHALSHRAERTFLPVNCGAIPESLVESALFGHEKGAFTDAHQAREGFFERADGGTLFLDEIDCLPLPAQARLLRVLQEGEYERVGGRHTRHTDVRIVAASNRGLERLVAEGSFRQDLYYRINVVPIHIPPLRERPDDLSALVGHFLRRLAEKYGGPRKVLGEHAWATAFRYPWPGNLRELENVLERAFLFASGSVIESLPVEDHQAPGLGATGGLREAKRRAGRELEARIIDDALARARGNVSAVAREMGVTPRALHMKLRGLGIAAAPYRVRHRA
ncbi:MAG: sigma-54 dependent transcriptional regulator [Chromatiaceae bacterium]